MLAYGAAADVTDNYLRLELEDRNRSAARELAARIGETAEFAMPEDEADSIDSADPPRKSEASRSPPPHLEPAATQRGAVGEELAFGSEIFAKKATVNRSGNGLARLVNVQMLKNGQPRDVFDFGDRVTLRQVVHFYESLRDVNVSYKIRTPQGADVVFGDTRLQHELQREYLAGRVYVFEWEFDLKLMHGNYCVMTGISQPPNKIRSDWLFIDIVPLCYDFRIAPRREGMIDGFVAWDTALRIAEAAETPLAAKVG
jgi:hypothetical protein